MIVRATLSLRFIAMVIYRRYASDFIFDRQALPRAANNRHPTLPNYLNFYRGWIALLID